MVIMYCRDVRVITSCITIFVAFLSMYWIFYRWIEFIGVASLLFASVFLHYHTIITSYPWIFDGYHVLSWFCVITSCITIFVAFLSMYWIFYRWIEFIGVVSLLFASVFLHYHTIITSYPWIFDGYHVLSWCSCDCIMHRNICGVSIDGLNLLAYFHHHQFAHFCLAWHTE